VNAILKQTQTDVIAQLPGSTIYLLHSNRR
jgi:hypothetical protein